MKKILWLAFIVIPLCVVLAGGKLYYSIGLWKYEGPNYSFEVKPGEGFASINGKLKRSGLIHSSQSFYHYSKYKKILTKFKAGRYEIQSKSTMLDVIETLTRGKSITSSVTLPEGKNLFEVAKILESKKIIKSAADFIRMAKDPAFAQSLGIPGERLEGYLYPETYHFTPSSTPKLVLKTMVQLFKKKTRPFDFSKSPLGLSKHEVIILASVVEKETGAGHERPMIAGVFINRLKKKMRLQSDPTTIYGIYETFNGNLRKKHLLAKTPYNTYKIPALPKGPISNPGLSSIKAVLNPSEHSFLYFVSQNDGTHVFSKSYRDHRQAVDKYQKNRNARKGKSWRDLHKKKL